MMKGMKNPMGMFSRLNLNKRDPVAETPPATTAGNTLEEQYTSLAELDQKETLGTGTFGRVRLAQHIHNHKYFALKILKKSEIIRLKQVEHVISEKAILSSVKHPFIIQLHATYQNPENLYMLLEYVPGGEIFSHLRRTGRFSNDTAKFYAGSIVLAVQYLHGMDIVYRDLKPENLLLDQRGGLKIADFGFAKKVTDRTWTLCGTPEYLAPEIIQSKGHGKGVDWWALGILIYEMLAGYPPFYDENPFGIYQKILLGKMEFPRHFDPYAKDLVKKLCTADRTKRFGNLKSGAEDVKKHKWFKGLDFNMLHAGEYKPPISPEVRSAGDSHNFDKYPESEEHVATLVEEETDRRLFKDF
mmetsp:Transcript_32145/g.70140  ORF Transcript_32145/g.70140 Transcript_32145/m.70140 type:complete len:357 (-) Transcript_32145:250-1320(-)